MLTLIRCPFYPRVTAVARKRPRSFCQKCRWQVTPKHAHTLDPTKSEWADYDADQPRYGNPTGNELTRNSSGYTQPQSSQLAEPLWTGPGLKNGISVRERIPTLEKKKKKRRWGMNGQIFSQSPHKRGKSQHQSRENVWLILTPAAASHWFPVDLKLRSCYTSKREDNTARSCRSQSCGRRLPWPRLLWGRSH